MRGRRSHHLSPKNSELTVSVTVLEYKEMREREVCVFVLKQLRGLLFAIFGRSEFYYRDALKSKTNLFILEKEPINFLYRTEND